MIITEYILRLFGRMDFFQPGVRYKTIQILKPRKNTKNGKFQIEWNGYSYIGDTAFDIDYNVYYFGYHDKLEVCFLKNVLKSLSSPVLLDIGANVGHHSLFLSKYAESVYAFEPNITAYKRIEEKIETNSVTNIYPFNIALSDVGGDVTFFAPSGHNLGQGSLLKSHKPETNLDVVSVKAEKGDSFLQKKGVEKVSLIKIDVEGSEFKALSGLADSLKKFRPIVLMEYFYTARKYLDSLPNKPDIRSFLPDDYEISRISFGKRFLRVFQQQICELRAFDDNDKDEYYVVFYPKESASVVEGALTGLLQM